MPENGNVSALTNTENGSLQIVVEQSMENILLLFGHHIVGLFMKTIRVFKSIVLMAIAGPNYEVLMFDLGKYGRQ